MASEARMILPKGIVLNTDTIYDDIAAYPVLPWKKLHQVWKVYNTTNHKLLDPTARRLENLWWRVWGSKCRNQPGRTIAGVYREISVGPTAVSIRGPDNRWEPGRDEGDYNRAIGRNGPSNGGPGKSPEGQDGQEGQDRSSTSVVPTTPQTRPQTTRAQSATSQVVLRPILKKGRRSSDKRQVTRFAATPQDANSAIDSEASSGSTAVVGRSGSEPARAQAERLTATATTSAKTTPKKKQVVTVTPTKRLTAVKRRPLMPRRQSSQSSTGSETTGASGVSGGARFSAVTDRSSPRTSPKPSESSPDTLLEEEGEDQDDDEPLKLPPTAAGKRPLNLLVHTKKKQLTAAPGTKLKDLPKPITPAPSKAILPSIQPVREERLPAVASHALTSPFTPNVTLPPAQTSVSASTVAPSPPTDTVVVPTQNSEPNPAPQPSTEMETAPTKSTPPIKPLTLRTPGPRTSIIGGIPLAFRSHSHQGIIGSDYRPTITSRFVSRPTTAAMSNIAARGILVDLEGETIGARRHENSGTLAALEGHGPESLSQSPPSALISAFLPTPASRATPVPMARTMSQLQVLLDRRTSAGGRPAKRNSRG